MQEITLAVLGATGVGKSTFVQCALDLKKPAISPSSTKKVSLEGVISIVRLIELQLEDVTITEDCSICWPTEIGDQSVPRIDGALVMCDVMDQSSMSKAHGILSKSICFDLVYPQIMLRKPVIHEYFERPNFRLFSRKNTLILVTNLLDAFTKDSIPSVLIFSKCDNPRLDWQINHCMMESFCDTLDSLEFFQTSANAPETHKRCVSIMVRNVISGRNGEIYPFLTPVMILCIQ